MKYLSNKEFKTISKPLIQNIEPFFKNVSLLSKHSKKSSSLTLIGWGMKKSGRKALELARKHNLEFLLVEDGFIRSLGLGVDSFKPHSIVCDSSGGIYYDSSKASDLEVLIKNDSLGLEQIKRSKDLIELIKFYRLSKYNHSEDTKVFSNNNSYVLVVDQTFGDASISYGGASPSSFLEMLETSIRDNPNSTILVKIHPDVISGKKKGHLFEAANKYNCKIISDSINPWALFDIVDKVYVVTSQLGFEALMAEKEVVCFGLPFYAGWGLTNDILETPRRNTTKTLEEVFHASYIRYSIYSNPYICQYCQLEDTIALISDQKQHLDKYTSDWWAIGFSSWKRIFLASYFGIESRLNFIKENNIEKALSLVPKRARVVIWASKLSEPIERLCVQKNIALSRMEDGFIRSVGLGVDLAIPMSLVIDSKGIYYDSHNSSDLEDILNNSDLFSSFLIKRAQKIRESLVELKLSKYNLGEKIELDFPSNKKVLLVPGQVEDDASIKKGTYGINTNYQLLNKVRYNNPTAFIIYKPHPDVLSGGRVGEVQSSLKDLVDLELLNGDMADILENVDEVHTMTSLTGFEALLRNIKVVTYGMPFYAGWGLTEDSITCDRRTKKLTLDQLVAGALICYPVYVEPKTGHVCNIETIIQVISEMKDKGIIHKPSLKTKLFRKLKNTF